MPKATEKNVMNQNTNKETANLHWIGPGPAGLSSRLSYEFRIVFVQYASELPVQGRGDWHDPAMYGNVYVMTIEK